MGTETKSWDLTVDGERFTVRRQRRRRHAYDFTWETGPNEGYGFTMAVMGSSEPLPQARLEDAARDFLEGIDPESGYLG